ncbi:MAG: hypothetical protein DHS20C21_17270 [Gemmatimonadota bacterium]|nr:MAG: hypothetical protein DHS20C21_17270 [Gemmatimonadota bacterium]
MPWIPWIKVDNEESKSDEARRLFRATRELDGGVSDLTRITSRTPAVAQLVHELGRAVYLSAKGLSLKEKEIAALVTSAFIGCVH